ncbi:MAG: replication restart helicase PriA, partial [Planctomycetota bacterium]
MGAYGTDSLFEVERAEEQTSGRIIRVVFESGADTEFDYLVPDVFWPVAVGQRVGVPFGRKNELHTGFCVGADIPLEDSFAVRGRGRKLKKVAGKVDTEPLVDSVLMELARWISRYYVCPLGQVLAAMVPSAVKKGAGTKTEKHIYLAENIDAAVEQLRGKKQKQIVQFLKGRGAFNSQNVVELQSLLKTIGCTDVPIKSLAEKEIVRIEHKTIITALPAVPKAMATTPGKIVLNEDQQRALAHVKSEIDSSKFGVTLLHGVTDSGKTELYIRAIEMVLQKCKSAVVLLPEIALTAQTVQRFSAKFSKIAVMHSGLSSAQRNAQWHKIKTGEADVVIGARSAVFAPVPKLGLIVVDEEHEPSYKQDTAPRYNGRDVAIKRAQLSNAHCLLGSATPSLEMLSNCRGKEHFGLVRLPKRVMNLPMPQMQLIDMRLGLSRQDGLGLISEPLAERLAEVITKKEQAILLLNRRGYSNFVFCSSCKHTLHCRNCDVTLTF